MVSVTDKLAGLASSMDNGRTLAKLRRYVILYAFYARPRFTHSRVHAEIDIIEGVNEMTANQQVIHTRPGCTKTTPLTQTSRSGPSSDCSSASGCVVSETQPNSYGAAFATAGGGVFAAQFDVSGIL